MTHFSGIDFEWSPPIEGWLNYSERLCPALLLNFLCENTFLFVTLLQMSRNFTYFLRNLLTSKLAQLYLRPRLL